MNKEAADARFSIYPKVDVMVRRNRLLQSVVLPLQTTLRVQGINDKGKKRWFLWDFVDTVHLPSDKPEVVAVHVNKFHAEIYKCQVLGDVVPDLVDMDNEPIFKEHKYQKSETDRLLTKNGVLNYENKYPSRKRWTYNDYNNTYNY